MFCNSLPRTVSMEWFCSSALLPKSEQKREGRGYSSRSKGLRKSYNIFWGTMILFKVRVAQEPSDG